MIVTFTNQFTSDKYIVELTNWRTTNFSAGPRRIDGWYRQVLSVNGKIIKPENESSWSIPRLSIERASFNKIYSRFVNVDPMISILFTHMRDRIYPFPNFYSDKNEWEEAMRKCDAVLVLTSKWDKLKVFI